MGTSVAAVNKVGLSKYSYTNSYALLGYGYKPKLLSGVLNTRLGKPPEVNCATLTPVLCAAAVVPPVPRVQPVKVVLVVPVYVIVSLAICIQPAASKPVVLTTVIVVTVLLMPPFKVVATTSFS